MFDIEKSFKHYIHVAVMLILIFGLQFVPSVGGLTPLGMQTLGIFIGTLYGWSVMGMTWPSLLALFALSLLPGSNAIETFKTGFGDRITVALVFFLLFGELINQVGLSKYIADWCVSRKFAQGKPYVVLFMFCVSGFLISACVNVFAAIILMWGIYYSYCKKVGMKPGDPFAMLSLILIVYICSMAGNLLPFMATSLMISSLQEQILNIPMPYLPFTLVQLILILLAGSIYFCLIKFVFRPNTDIAKNYIAEDMKQSMTGQQKFVFVLLLALLVMLFIPGLLPTDIAVVSAIKALDISGIIAILLVVYYVTNLNNKEAIPFVSLTKGLNWDLLLMFATIAPMTGAISNEETGIMATVNVGLNHLVGDMSPILFCITILMIGSVLTQVSNNVSVMLLVVPIMYSFAVQLDANPIVLSILAAYNLNVAFCTPAASGQAAMVYSNTTWIDTKSAYKHGFIIFGITTVVTILGIFIAEFFV